MGIDHIFVDESHQFKNLMFNTRHAIRTIQERTGKDLGATFLSGTTISNSLTELYLLFKYLRPKELERQNINSFDAWAAIFAKKTTDFEFSVTNNIVQKERFRYFIKVPELAQFYNEITDYRTAEDVGVDRPQKNEILHNIPPTPQQEEFIEKLMQFAQSGDATILG
ncbi:DNA methylase, partial [Phocaeicola dorei]|nr:DNA methylase [Phocaeicola dorei]